MTKKYQISLRVGIVGCGNMSKVHARLLLKYAPNTQIAVCDRDELRLREFATHFGIEKTYIDLDKMLKDFEPDVVHIVTPPKTHKEIAIKCLENKCHVLIEKPMCVSIEEADAISEAAKKNNRLVCVDHMRSFDPMVRKAKELISSGKLGEVANIHVGYSYDYLKRVNTDAAARWINELPGGSFFDLMPHLLCLLEDFFPNVKVEKVSSRKDTQGVLTDLHCIFNAAKGTGTLHMSLNLFPLKNYVEFECSNGVLRIDLRNFLFIVRKNYGLPNAIERIVENLSIGLQFIRGSLGSVFNFICGKLDPYAGLDYIIQSFYDAISKGESSPVPPAKARKLLSLTEEIFKDNQSSGTKEQVLRNQLQASDVLVTGGTGFIGRRLVNQLLHKGYKVRVFTHRDISRDELRCLFKGPVNLVKGNIYQYQDIKEACDGISTVYHLAAAMQGDWNYHLDTTITGTQNILKASETMGVKHFVYASTLNVYNAKNYPNNGGIAEDFAFEDNPDKRGAYSHAKLKAEERVRQFMNKTSMTITILRPGLVYGPGGNQFPRDVGIRLGKKLVIVMGMGARKLPLVYVDNLVDAFIAVGESGEKSNGQVYNIVDPDYPTQRHFIKNYRDITKENFFVFYIPLNVFMCGFWMLEKFVFLFFKKTISICYKLKCISRSPRYSIKKIREQLGWVPKVEFKKGLELTIKGMR